MNVEIHNVTINVCGDVVDLPRLEWPASVPVTEDTPEPTLPSPEDVPAGEVWKVKFNDRKWVGVRKFYEPLGPWSLASMDGTDHTYTGDRFVTLISRLVPEVTP